MTTQYILALFLLLTAAVLASATLAHSRRAWIAVRAYLVRSLCFAQEMVDTQIVSMVAMLVFAAGLLYACVVEESEEERITDVLVIQLKFLQEKKV